MVRREGFEPPAFWSVGCLMHKSESFRLRFVLFATIRSADFPVFSSRPARFFRILGQMWVKTSLQADYKRVSVMALTLAHLEKESFIIHYKNKGRIRARFNYTFILCFLLPYCDLWSDKELYKMTETFDSGFSRKIYTKGKKVNEIPKNQRKSPCGTSGFFSGAPP